MQKKRYVPCGVVLLGAVCVCSPLLLALVAGLPPLLGEPAIQVLSQSFSQTEIAQGQELYSHYCAVCHGLNGEGQFPESPLEPDSTGRFGAPPHNDSGHSWHHSDTLLLRYVTEGGFANPDRFYPMPALGSALTEEQIMLVIAYIKTLWSDEQREMQHHLTQEELAQFGES
jgi:mono/diheme cytochrome c family protein